MENNHEIELSVVCTIFRSAQIVPELVRQVELACGGCTSSFEVILVDDSSPDLSWAAIVQACRSTQNVRGIKLGRNFGQQVAVAAGLRQASGEYSIVMDGDLQNPPEAIVEILKKLKEGNDIVYTTSLSRNSIIDGLTSRVFWWIMNKIFKINVIPNQLMMRGMSKRFVDLFNCYNEHIRNVVGITHDIGLKQAVIKVANNKRHSGRSNYNFFKRFDVMLDVVLLMTNRPLTYVIYAAAIAFISSIILGIMTLINYLQYPEMPAGYTTQIFLISIFGSSTLIVLGIIGRYLANIYTEVRARPLFNIEQAINLRSVQK
jgi:polyisoprenyl-phosphate glycosyltransferase